MGARFTSVDISQAQLDTAASRAGEIGLDIAFLRAGVVDLRELGDEGFDLVYTGRHVAVWVSDLKRHYAEACRILQWGGMLMVTFRRIWRASPDRLELACGYFERGPPPLRPLGRCPPGSLPSYEFNWTVSDYVTALMHGGCELVAIRPARAVGVRAAGGAAWHVVAGRPEAVTGSWSVVRARRGSGHLDARTFGRLPGCANGEAPFNGMVLRRGALHDQASITR